MKGADMFTIQTASRYVVALTGLVAAGIILGSDARAQSPGNGTDSHCVIEKNSRLFNQCSYDVDVGFCVENPQQTKNFYDSSGAFTCPNGGISTLGPGKDGGNILHGTVHWWACSTRTRGGGKWRYVEGTGYRGDCVTAKSAGPSETAEVSPPAAAAECKDVEARGAAMRSAKDAAGFRTRINYARMVMAYLDRGCTSLPPDQRAAYRKQFEQSYASAVSECKGTGASDCESPAPGHRPPAAQPATATDNLASRNARQGGSEPSPEQIAARCTQEVKAAADAGFAGLALRQGNTLSRADVLNNWQFTVLVEAKQTLEFPVGSLMEYRAQFLRQAEAYSKPLPSGNPDVHREVALVKACLTKARFDLLNGN